VGVRITAERRGAALIYGLRVVLDQKKTPKSKPERALSCTSATTNKQTNNNDVYIQKKQQMKRKETNKSANDSESSQSPRSGFSLRAVFVGLGRESCENECVSERGSAHVMTLPSQHIEKIGGDQSAATSACLIMILRAELS
jgi:hypothetical protein